MDSTEFGEDSSLPSIPDSSPPVVDSSLTTITNSLLPITDSSPPTNHSSLPVTDSSAVSSNDSIFTDVERCVRDAVDGVCRGSVDLGPVVVDADSLLEKECEGQRPGTSGQREPCMYTYMYVCMCKVFISEGGRAGGSVLQ